MKSLTIIKSSSAVFAIQFYNSADFLIESVRRTEFLLFLINIFDNKNLKRPEIIQSVELKLLKKKNKEEILQFNPAKSDISKNNKQLFGHLISTNFINAYMCGYLVKRSENWFKAWTEKFCVLTNVGLLYYNDP